ncbi:hypothetical protein CLIB1444_18S00562 [[Candida] jaroonii]|uniref:Uncharacterized protein n=1 Tax=[Candida] jaroonii TaxID=467808 RepID=A0ACA9YEZ6_9ASCO|nr:hypothetical protein CLIB1444_18S00562 [[Candida] jaroonii]
MIIARRRFYRRAIINRRRSKRKSTPRVKRSGGVDHRTVENAGKGYFFKIFNVFLKMNVPTKGQKSLKVTNDIMLRTLPRNQSSMYARSTTDVYGLEV